MDKQFEQVKEFHTAFGIEMPDKPHFLHNGPLTTNNWLTGSLHCLTEEIKAVSSQKYCGETLGGQVAKRASLMLEELTEFTSADDLPEQVDALIDLIYIAIGTLTLMGVKPEPIFNIVHEANMAKLGPDGPIYNEHGKIQKPEGWEKPNKKIDEEIYRQRNESGSVWTFDADDDLPF